MYRLQFTDFGVADVRALPKNVRNSLKRELRNKLGVDPAGCSYELQGSLREYRSYHWRDYRIVFRVFPEWKAVAIVGIGKHSREARRDIYRRLEVLAESGQIAGTVLAALRGFTPRGDGE